MKTILSRLEKVRAIGADRWMACCPAHDDKTPSLVITDAGDKILMHCYAGCSTDEILTALGMKWSDLYRDEWMAAREAAYASRKPLGKADPLAVEENVVLIAKEKLENGGQLTVEDEARVKLAIERIESYRNAR